MKIEIEVKADGKIVDIDEVISQATLTNICRKVTADMNKGLWKPENGEKYYFLNLGGDVRHDYNVSSGELAIGNYFKTKEEAEQKARQLKAIQRVKEYIAENFGVFEPDWGDENQVKSYVDLYDFEYNNFVENYNYSFKNYSPFGFLKTRDDTKQLIKDCEEDLKLIFEV